MAQLPPPVATVRAALREALHRHTRPGRVLVACSGGADSLALATAAAFVGPRAGRAVGLVTVDHGLQPGSADRAAAVADWGDVRGRPGGPEAAAREARYAALVDAARRSDAVAVLLGHTRDDQAETVLLALARGAGPRGLAGMPVSREVDGIQLLRPLLGVSRADTRTACTAEGLQPWEDPHNVDPAYARSRVRASALPALVDALGPAVLDNLARTATLLAADAAALDAIAAAALAACRTDAGLRLGELAELAPAVRTRVLHGWCRELGAPGAALSHRHVTALDALVVDWHGQGPAWLPGGIGVARRGDLLVRVDAL
jgi:tRNA(Ile)-lysidine synthase